MMEELKSHGNDDDEDACDDYEEAVDEADGEYETIEPSYIRARSLFHKPDVTAADDVELKWTDPDEAGNLLTYIHTCPLLHTHTRTHVYIYIYIYICVCVCVCVCVYVCVYVCMCA